MPGVAEHACFGRPDPTTGERLAVAVRPADGATVTLDAVLEHLLAAGVARRKLPEELVLWDEPLPRTNSEKIVRSQLVRDAAGKRSEVVERLRVGP
jgi:acyl-coenzyme A synthetase/AMP-(fatty) acid ligase